MLHVGIISGFVPTKDITKSSHRERQCVMDGRDTGRMAPLKNYEKEKLSDINSSLDMYVIGGVWCVCMYLSDTHRSLIAECIVGR